MRRKDTQTHPTDRDFSSLTLNDVEAEPLGRQDPVPSPNSMMVDQPEELFIEPNMNNNSPADEDVAIITPDSLEGAPDEPSLPRADDVDAMREHVLHPLLEEPKILDDVHNTWTVESWRGLNRKEHGPIFQAGGFPWRILLFPFGNNVDQCSVYLEHGFEANNVPEDWSCCVQFALVVWNPNDPRIFFSHTAHHRFTKEEADWGFTRFLELRKMFNLPWEDYDRPLVENDTANITAYVRVVEDETGVMWHNLNNYDSKKETGYVGLKNQGATCYLNSLLQSLYFTNAFRKAIYQIPTEQDESMSNSAYTLQRLFYQLQTSPWAVSTGELTKSFGWETRHIFEQQDVQELSRKLMERMEEKMKGTANERLLPSLFTGKYKTYISCINVDYESSRIEDFWDVQLNVSGNKNLLESFKDYIQVEKLEGENQYMAGDEYKLQDANKGVIFMSFPDVLHLQLKRFEYDIMRDQMMKINDRYEFPEEFDAAPYLDESADKTEAWDYELHGVLVHSGDLNAGHYYAFIKPNKDGWWYRYDDDKVTKATKREVLEENFGGEYRTPAHLMRSPKKTPVMRPNSAYMLVYIRKSRVDSVLTPVTAQDTPAFLAQKFEREAAEKEARKKEREEQHLYLPIKVITKSSFEHHGGVDLAAFDAPADDPAAPRAFRALRSMTMQELVDLIAKDIGEDPKRVRLWLMVNRQNKTIRPDQPVMDLRPTVEETANRATAVRDNSLRLWAEVAEEVNADGEAIWPSYQGGQTNGVVVKNDQILLFLKHFDVESQELHGVGHFYISKEKRVEEVVPIIAKKMGWGDKLPNDEKLMLWEEIKPSMIEILKSKQSLKAAELQDGDIICFQRVPEKRQGGLSLEKRLGLGERGSEESQRSSPDRFEDAKEYYDFLLHRRAIKFSPHPTRGDPQAYQGFELVLSSKTSYDKLSEKVGEHLGVNPTHLRFFPVNQTTGGPKAPVKRGQNVTLSTILSASTGAYGSINLGPRHNELMFEVLDISLAELDTKKPLKVVWLSEGITKEDMYDILVSKAGNVQDLIQSLILKAKLPDEATAGPIRVYEVHSSKIFRELARDYPVISTNDYNQIVAERIPADEIAADRTEEDDGAFINVFHFQGEPSRAHGMPFKFLMKDKEPFSETKKRLEKRTGLKGKSFEKIKFAIVRRSHFSRPQYLNDDDVLWDVATQEDDTLGLDHPDRSRSRQNGTDLFLKG